MTMAQAQAGGSAVVEVTYTGVGIAPEDLKHVFKRFWRGEKSRYMDPLTPCELWASSVDREI